MNILKGVLLAVLVLNASGQPNITVYTNGNLRIVTIIEPIANVLIGNPMNSNTSNTITTHPSPPTPAGTPIVWLPDSIPTVHQTTTVTLVTNMDKSVMIKRTVKAGQQQISRKYQSITFRNRAGLNVPASVGQFVKEDGAFVELIGPSDCCITTAIYQHPAKWTLIEQSDDLINWWARDYIQPGTGAVGTGTPMEYGGHFFRAYYGHPQ